MTSPQLALTLFGFAAIASGCATTRTAPAKTPDRVLVTGSRIPVKVGPHGIPSTASPVRFYSRQALNNAGRGTTSEALGAAVPSITVPTHPTPQ